VTGIRMVITKAKATMAVATLEDLQGTLEVVVFPRTYEQTVGVWREGSILLVAGRVDHRGEEVSLLADAVWDWDVAVASGPEGFARAVGQLGDRGGRRRPSGSNGNGSNGNGSNGNGSNGHGPNGNGAARGPQGPLRPEPVVAAVAAPPRTDAIGGVPRGAPVTQQTPVRVSPLRGGALAPDPSLPRVAPATPVPTYVEPTDLAALGPEQDEPALPDEARAVEAAAQEAPSRPLELTAGAVLHVRFVRAASSERVVAAMETLLAVRRERPGSTPMVVHVPAPGGRTEEFPLRGIAYDAELLSEVRRRIGDGVIELGLQ
jgi:hypothetical protein